MAKGRNYPRREPRKQPLMFDERGRVVKRDASEFSILLCWHGDTPGGAHKVSFHPDLIYAEPQQGGIFFLPIAMCERGEVVGGFERLSPKLQREIIPIHEFTMPRYFAIQKKLTQFAHKPPAMAA